MRVLVVRHDEEDSPGLVGDAFAALGAVVDTCLYPSEGRLPDPGRYDHLVVLGSSASVYENRDWIVAEVDWLRGARLPVLGICFGAQLLSAALGGGVERAPAYEIGWVTVDPVVAADAPRSETALGLAIGSGPWFQFHRDRCVLPGDAHLLARNEIGVQAFTVGPHLGVQFHPEVDAAQLTRWIHNGARNAIVRAGLDPDALLEETARAEADARIRADDLVGAHLRHVSA